jgi:phospholipid/cholesterol/gamma-HCH transport system substrate-binding protein
MTERKRNTAVGLTALIAFCGLGYMILLFGDTPAFARRGYYVMIHFPGSGTIDKGAEVRLNGIRVGAVSEIHLQDDPRQGVRVRCRIQTETRIPADVLATVGQHGFGGSGYVRLRASAPSEPAEPTWLPTDGSAMIQGVRQPGGMLGPEMAVQLDAVADGFRAFSRLADSLTRALEAPDSPEPVAGLAGTIQRLNRVLDDIGTVTGDEKSLANLTESLANLRRATEAGADAMAELGQFARQARESLAGVDRSTEAMTEAAQTAQERMDHVAVKLIDDADRLGALLSTLNKAATRIADGSGTAGRLINDPALYNSLLESTEALAKTLAEMELTIKLWREEGVRLRLK